MRNEVNMTDEQIEQRFEELGYGCIAEEVIWTNDTLDDFIANAADYADHGEVSREDDSVLIEDAQARKGDQRRDVVVIDFGSVRGCYS